MKLLAIDDERLSLNVLVKAIGKAAPDAEIAAFQSASEGLDFVAKNTCDAAFLDIAMYDMNGL